jgi:HPt (histidine-containing phosphotransfer) domain-containing protein
MNDFLSKPIDRADLVAMVAKWSRAQEAPGAAVAPVADGSPILDETIVQNLEHLVGKDEAQAIAQMFLSHIRDIRPILDDRENRAALAREVHDLVSLAGNVGCTELMELARDLSIELKQGGIARDDAVGKVVAATDRALSALSQRFAA